MLDFKVAVVTGGGSGIGRAIAERLIREGSRVCITGPDRYALDEVAEQFDPETLATCVGDVTKSEDNERSVRTALDLGGRLDILVNNAAVGTDPASQMATYGCSGSVLESDVDAWRRTLEVNLTGAYLMTRACLPHMVANMKGSIINIASVGGVRALPEASAYGSSKAGMIMLARQTAADYGRYGVRVNAICPGWVQTPSTELELATMSRITGREQSELLTEVARNVPLRRVASADEIAGVCVFLAGDDSSYMTGAAVVVDGGSSIVDAATLIFDPDYLNANAA